MSRAESDAALTKDEVIRSSHPPHIPSLIGIQGLKYLDATGLVRHRSIGDLMRYAIINEGLDTLAHYGDFQPAARRHGLQRRRGDEV